MIPRYNRPAIQSIWSDENKFKIWTEIECLIAEKLSELGEIPNKAAEDMKTSGAEWSKDLSEMEKLDKIIDLVSETTLQKNATPFKRDGKYKSVPNAKLAPRKLDTTA